MTAARVIRSSIDVDILDARRVARRSVPDGAPAPPIGLAAVRLDRRERARSASKRLALVGWRQIRPIAQRVRMFLERDVRSDLALTANHLNVRFSEIEAQLVRSDERVAALLAELQQHSRRADELLRASEHAQVSVLSSVERFERDQHRRFDDIEVLADAAARRVAVPIGAGDILISTHSGYLLCAADDLAVVTCLIDSGDLEAGTRKLIERLLQPGGVFVDVGANIGIHAIAAARAVGPTGRVLAFEPFERSATLLRRSASLNGHDHVDVVEVALSDERGRSALHLGTSSGHHSLLDLAGSAQTVEVDVTTLDDALGELGAERVDVLKIDVEGLELQVLRGALRTLDANPDIVLIVEFGPSHLDRAGIDARQWFDAFGQLGLRWVAIEPETGDLVETSIDDVTSSISTNLLLARDAAGVWQGASAR